MTTTAVGFFTLEEEREGDEFPLAGEREGDEFPLVGEREGDRDDNIFDE